MAYFFCKNFWLDLLFPVRCLSCGREAAPGQEFLCPPCRLNLKFSTNDFNLKIENVDQILIAGDYENPLLADLIKKLKFNSLPALGKILAEFISLFWQGRAILPAASGALAEKNFPASKNNPAFKNITNHENIIVIPIPLSRKRQRARGFNQAEIIARRFAENFSYTLDCRLIKKRHTKAQSGLSAKKRSANLRDVFAWSGESLQDKNIILIDDVITTGATIQEAAKILKQAGAEKISALAAAKG